MIEYTLTMNSDQAKSCLKAVELLMRLKINQPEEIPFNLILELDDFSKRRDKARPLLEQAFRIMYEGKKTGEWKDSEWYRLYNLYQALRYQIHQAEHPWTTGVDSYPPMRLTDEPIPACEYKKVKTIEV